MSRSKFRRGDLVVLCQRSWLPEIAKHQGDLARVTHREEQCEDYHKARYAWYYDLEFVVSGKKAEGVRESAIEAVDPVSALGRLTKSNET